MVLTCVILGRWMWGMATASFIAGPLGMTTRRVRDLLTSLAAAGEVERGHYTSYGYIWRRVGPHGKPGG